MIGQTIIPVNAENELTFANFIIGENGALVQQLEEVVTRASSTSGSRNSTPSIVYLWAESGAGKSHLIHSLCELARSNQSECHFLSLSEINVLDRLNEYDFSGQVVCVDNLQVICGNRELEIAFLSFYERLCAASGCLAVAARKPPNKSGFVLADLASRLNAGAIWRVIPMTDRDKKIALRQRAEVRGFMLTEQVMDFVMTHFDRDTVSLFALLDRIDRASLAHHRKVTVPSIKEIIG